MFQKFMCFEFCKYEKEELTLLNQNFVQQMEEKRYFLFERHNQKTSFSPTKLFSTHHRITTKQPFFTDF